MRPLYTRRKDETFTLNSIKVEWIKFFFNLFCFPSSSRPLKFSLRRSATRLEMIEICDVPTVIFLEELFLFAVECT